MNLRLDFIGAQARHFGGQLLGLPVIGLVGNRQKAPNIMQPTCDQSVGTLAELDPYDTTDQVGQNILVISEEDDSTSSAGFKMSRAHTENINDVLSHGIQVGVGQFDNKLNEGPRHNESIQKTPLEWFQPQDTFQARIKSVKVIQRIQRSSLPSISSHQNSERKVVQSIINIEKPNLQVISQHELPPRPLRKTKVRVEAYQTSQQAQTIQRSHSVDGQLVEIKKREQLKSIQHLQQHVSIPSSIPGLCYDVKTRDQYIVKWLQNKQYYKIKHCSSEIKGIILAVTGENERASKLLTGCNLCVCLIQMNNHEEAKRLATTLKFQPALDYLDFVTPQKSLVEKQESYAAVPVSNPISESVSISRQSNLFIDICEAETPSPQRKRSPSIGYAGFETISGSKTMTVKRRKESGGSAEFLKSATFKAPEVNYLQPPSPKFAVKSVFEIDTKHVLSKFVIQQFAMLERFKQEIGGADKLDSYIKQYAQEISNGDLLETRSASHNKPWSRLKTKKETAYELSNTKYLPFKQTINMLLEQYANNKEHFSSQKIGLHNMGHLTPKSTAEHQDSFQTKDLVVELPNAVDAVEKRLKELEKKKRLVTPRIQDLMADLGNQDIHRLTKAKGHLEKLLDDSQLSNPNSECLDPHFWDKVQVAHRTSKKPDIFEMNEEQYRNLYKDLTVLVQTHQPKQHQKPLTPSEQEQSYTANFCSHVLSLISTTPQDDLKSMAWLNQLLEEYSVSLTIRRLLQFNKTQIMADDKLDECLGSSNQQRCSVLMLIREEFAKIQHKKADKNQYLLLSRMLSKVNYFSHFDCQTRQKLIEISKHSIYRQGAVIINSENLADKILVVLSGAVSVVMKDRNRPADFEIVRHTLYPGDSIGDAPLRLILTSDNLHFYLVATLDADVLLMKKADVPEILKDEIMELLQNKIMPLQSCTLFAGEDHQSPYNIFVLANLVTVKPYQIGEVIQKQGQQADDSMYLVVRGYCRAVFESTLIKLKPKSKAPQFSNSKETFGELGVLMRHLKSEKSDYFQKNLPPTQKRKLVKMMPGYLPKPVQLVAKEIQIFDSVSRASSTLCSDQEEDSKTEKSEEHEGHLSSRTVRNENQAALVGHYGSRIIETAFEYKPKKTRIVENQPLNINPQIRKASQLRRHLADLHFTQPKQDFLGLQDNVKIQTHIDIVQHANQIGQGEIFCARAMLEQARSVKALGAELNEFLASQKAAPVKDANLDMNRLKRQIRINDRGLAPEMQQALREHQEDQSVQIEQQTQKGEPTDPVWQQIFQQLRSLLGDAQVKQMTAAALYQQLNKSQLTIVADSSDLVLLRIRQQDLSQLSEPVRRRIEREIKNQLYVDIDRPFTTHAQFDQFVSEYQKWHKTKQKTSLAVLTEKKHRVHSRVANQVNGPRTMQ